ncbi:thiol-activated cytolysin family protein [Pedobacter sp. D749]|uniref:thiol-activated cytolysin family protein n=1 Tax=Pedobacter sp. D749 TaxID=2856523 RepID=UPI001C57E803|nr:thiol-activated cytolysin family protein [Pedobacter sp. D749]QXU41865.1 thiol-activated cytolysin family protein [Pedobacter sp. D749]
MKKINILSGVMLLILFIASGCRKMESDALFSAASKDFKGLKKSVLSPFSVKNNEYSNLGSLGAVLERRKMDGGSFDGPPLIAGTYRTGELVSDFGADPNKVMFVESFKSNVFVISPEMGLNIFPGAILNGNSIRADVFAPSIIPNISANIRPVNLSTSLPVSGTKVAKTVMARPSSDRAFVRAALKDLNDINPGRIGAARLQFEMTSFSNYDMIKTLYGYNKNLDLFLYKQGNTTTGGSQSVTRSTGFILKFYQQNFTVDVDVPSDYNELFDPTGLDTATVFGGKSPYYVSSVTYGRMGIMTIESNSDSASVYNAVTKQIGILQGLVGIGTSLSDSEKQILESSEIKYAITGPNGDKNVSDLKTISSLAGFVEVLSSNSTYSMDDPGVPISFRLRYLVDDTNVEAPFEINYGPFNKPYARIEYRNIVAGQNNAYSYHTSDITLVCYPTQDCIPGTEVPPLNFISFAWNFTSKISRGKKGDPVTPIIHSRQDVVRNSKNRSLLLIHSGEYKHQQNFAGDDREQYEEDYSLLSGKGYYALPSKYF